ncbi:mycofactocin biosynthesis glycosyltransferase MftF [Gordonia hankookensis]|uniref:Mycofactocin biosynthesis glycosyltransferase MftF n=1 Tax=Gordonia hankookensis TaxID=589403 RepID=A0ABR7W7M9_9ACTN|nr:mycofactocin biosynthesis glycosyltransferase MftF [Gordonia hankookensis]MBD1318831.1 mycofactocin biosynthesis glycosyltransferase MftF [Gordonia hankookensis]NDZ94351.1 mycofactocin system glycosyltransferase [Streptomyces sp. SID11726]NEB24999.1 mycofactocin system glycosyltransferase [Streptomyces sp. SID6673]
MTAVEKELPPTSAVEHSLPDGFQVQIDMRCAPHKDLRYLVGGSPTRMLRLTDAALGMTSADGRIEVVDAATRSLARRLLDSGIANPRPMFGPRPENVTVVVPVRGNQSGVDRLLQAVSGAKVIVVDDGSDVPLRACGRDVTLIRFDENRGPSAARNAGAAAATTDFVAFLDSDVVPPADWLTMLLGHFSDPAVAIVAPRIVGLSRDDCDVSLSERYENGYSSLDMGPDECSVVPGSRVPYVPSAAMLVRRSAFQSFDESMRVAEDVDLCWRTHKAGWRVRYDPVSQVCHDHRTGMRSVLDRRRYYGTGASYLADRHGGFAAPVVMSVPMAAAVVALMTRTKIGLAIAMIILGQIGMRLRRRLGELPDAPIVATQMTGRAVGFGLLQAAGAICRHYWPVAVILAIVSARFRRLAVEVAIAEGMVSWVRQVVAEPEAGPALGPVAYTLFRRLDDLAYGAGLWQGAWSHRDFGALRPVITNKT